MHASASSLVSNPAAGLYWGCGMPCRSSPYPGITPDPFVPDPTPSPSPEFRALSTLAEPTRSSEEIDPDSALLLEVAGGSEQALAALVDRWQRPLVSFFHRSLQSHADAEDLAQATFVRLYRAAPRYEPRARFSTYLFQIARRLLLNELRRRQRKPATATDPADLRSAVAEDPRTGQAARELEEAFQAALANLPENHRSALLLYKQQEMSYEEIAEALEVPLTSIKSWIHRARQKLRIALREYHDKT